MLSVQPTHFARRSPLYRWHLAAGAEFCAQQDGASPLRYPGEAADPAVLAFADLSMLRRLGLKGWNAWSTLRSILIEPPQANNRAVRMPGGGLALRLGDNEALLLDAVDGTAPLLSAALGLAPASGCYPVPRRDTHAWLLLLGAATPELLAKLCAVDLRLPRFADLAIAQTMVARLGAVVARCDLAGVPAFHLLVDSASAAWLWDALLVAGEEFDGRALGLEGLWRLAMSCAKDLEMSKDGEIR